MLCEACAVQWISRHGIIYGFIKMHSFKKPHLRGTVIFTDKREHALKEILLKSQHLEALKNADVLSC